MANKKSKEQIDMELGLATAYDYKQAIDKVVLRLYLHTIGLIGIVFVVIGLQALYPMPPTDALLLVIFGVITIIAAIYFENKINAKKG